MNIAIITIVTVMAINTWILTSSINEMRNKIRSLEEQIEMLLRLELKRTQEE